MPDTFPFLIIGNKIDLTDHREVPTVDGRHFADEGDMAFLETSAKDNINVADAFKSLGRLAV